MNYTAGPESYSGRNQQILSSLPGYQSQKPIPDYELPTNWDPIERSNLESSNVEGNTHNRERFPLFVGKLQRLPKDLAARHMQELDDQ